MAVIVVVLAFVAVAVLRTLVGLALAEEDEEKEEEDEEDTSNDGFNIGGFLCCCCCCLLSASGGVNSAKIILPGERFVFRFLVGESTKIRSFTSLECVKDSFFNGEEDKKAAAGVLI